MAGWVCPRCGSSPDDQETYWWLRRTIQEYEERRRLPALRVDPDQPYGPRTWWQLALAARRPLASLPARRRVDWSDVLRWVVVIGIAVLWVFVCFFLGSILGPR